MNPLDILKTLAEPAEVSTVVAIVRLVGSRRSWFVAGVVGDEAVVYSPGCHHGHGGWFRLPLGWFEAAAAAIGDRVSVELVVPPVALDDLVDESL